MAGEDQLPALVQAKDGEEGASGEKPVPAPTQVSQLLQRTIPGQEKRSPLSTSGESVKLLESNW